MYTLDNLSILLEYVVMYKPNMFYFISTGRYDRIPLVGDRDLTTERSKASWELRKGYVGVYAIQGRRPHMEDRFNVVNDLEHTDTSIYGIFDGHGGEVLN